VAPVNTVHSRLVPATAHRFSASLRGLFGTPTRRAPTFFVLPKKVGKESRACEGALRVPCAARRGARRVTRCVRWRELRSDRRGESEVEARWRAPPLGCAARRLRRQGAWAAGQHESQGKTKPKPKPLVPSLSSAPASRRGQCLRRWRAAQPWGRRAAPPLLTRRGCPSAVRAAYAASSAARPQGEQHSVVGAADHLRRRAFSWLLLLARQEK